jgi:hypothetical protein
LDIAHEVIPADAGEPIEVVARSGHHVLVRSGFDPHSLRQVLEVLDAGC